MLMTTHSFLAFDVHLPQEGWSALYWASQNGELSMVKALLEHRANVNVQRNVSGSWECTQCTFMITYMIGSRFCDATMCPEGPGTFAAHPILTRECAYLMCKG